MSHLAFKNDEDFLKVQAKDAICILYGLKPMDLLTLKFTVMLTRINGGLGSFPS